MNLRVIDVMPLFSYQQKAAEFLASRRFALLADEPRVGKTPSVIAACGMIGANKILVVCPAVARADWVRKFSEYSDKGYEAFPIFMSDSPYLGKDVLVTSYSLTDCVATPARRWDVLILDESHYLKSLTAKRTKSILGKNGIAHTAQRVWFVTGTPAINNASEMWTMLYACGVYSRSYDIFLREFCTGYTSPYGFRITGSKNVEVLRQKLKNFMLRRTMETVRPEIPPVVFDIYPVACGDKWELGFPPKESKMANELEKALSSGADMMATLESMAPALASLRRYLGLMKIGAMTDHVKELNLSKIVIFAVHRDVILSLQEALMGFGAVSLHGGTSPAQREIFIRKFQTDPNCRVFIGQIQAAGTNIDLSVANHCCILESSFTPGDNSQAINRVRNVNKKTPVTCEFISLVNSVDEKISSIIRRKTSDLLQLFG